MPDQYLLCTALLATTTKYAEFVLFCVWSELFIDEQNVIDEKKNTNEIQ